MRKNTAVGWVALIGLIFLGIFIVAAIAAAVDSPTTVTTSCTADYTSCTTSLR